MNGILLVDKPSGWTSHDIVAKVRSTLRQAMGPESRVQSKKLTAQSSLLTARAPKVRVGHAGTLDPLATGLMIILVGSYTKRAQEFLKLDKTYEAVIKLGQTSTTGDEEGAKQVTSIKKQVPNIKRVEGVLKNFVGTSLQTPHVYSAVKIGGKRAYKLARAGKEFKIEPRTVTIYSIDNIEYKYPLVSFTIKVSSGTYIRSLAEDIGQKLATGAYLTSLRRTQIDKFSLDNAIKIAALKPENIHKHLQK